MTQSRDSMQSHELDADGGQRVLNNSADSPIDAKTERRRFLVLIAVALLVLSLDQRSKLWIRGNIRVGDEIALWPGVVHLSHVWNNGAAWGMLSGQRVILVVVTIAVLCGAASMARDFVRRGMLTTLALAFIVGGAIGNLIDRVFLGHVTDMIDMETSWNWLRAFPVFNLADSALTLGVILLMIHFLSGDKTPSSAQSE